MGKLVVLNLLEGNFERGFPTLLEIGADSERAAIAIRGYLPAAPHIPELFRNWQVAFRDKVNPHSRGQAIAQSRIKPRTVTEESCRDSARELALHLNIWLKSGGEWQKIRDGLQQHLSKDDEIRVIIQTENIQLRQLPWQAWDLFALTYNKAEIALSAPEYESFKGKRFSQKSSQVRILAVFGNSDRIDIQFDRLFLERFWRSRGAKIESLWQPTRQELLAKLWEERGWHIFFFAGHSSSESDGQIGWFDINPDESLEIDELKNGLSTAIGRGLQLAIFNSCDGLGLANQLAELQLPQSIIMREPVPDRVAQEFLQYFLTAFASDRSFYASMREARLKLESWEKLYPGATWLPIVCQNPAVTPPTWRSWRSRTFSDLYKAFLIFLIVLIFPPSIALIRVTTLDKPLCRGSSCIGLDPKDAKCDKDGVTITSTDRERSPTVVKVELRYSKRCDSTWVKTEGEILPRTDYLEDRQGKRYGEAPIPHTHPQYYSDMGPGNIEIKACTRPLKGEPKCTGFVKV